MDNSLILYLVFSKLPHECHQDVCCEMCLVSKKPRQTAVRALYHSPKFTTPSKLREFQQTIFEQKEQELYTLRRRVRLKLAAALLVEKDCGLLQQTAEK